MVKRQKQFNALNTSPERNERVEKKARFLRSRAKKGSEPSGTEMWGRGDNMTEGLRKENDEGEERSSGKAKSREKRKGAFSWGSASKWLHRVCQVSPQVSADNEWCLVSRLTTHIRVSVVHARKRRGLCMCGSFERDYRGSTERSLLISMHRDKGRKNERSRKEQKDRVFSLPLFTPSCVPLS